MKKRIIAIGLFGVTMAIYIKSSWITIKYAVKYEQIKDYTNSILVWEAFHTGTGWEQVGTQEGMFSPGKRRDVYLTGDIPPNIWEKQIIMRL